MLGRRHFLNRPLLDITERKAAKFVGRHAVVFVHELLIETKLVHTTEMLLREGVDRERVQAYGLRSLSSEMPRRSVVFSRRRPKTRPKQSATLRRSCFARCTGLLTKGSHSDLSPDPLSPEIYVIETRSRSCPDPRFAAKNLGLRGTILDGKLAIGLNTLIVAFGRIRCKRKHEAPRKPYPRGFCFGSPLALTTRTRGIPMLQIPATPAGSCTNRQPDTVGCSAKAVCAGKI